MKSDNATCVVWKMLTVAWSRFCKLNAPELLKNVWKGVKFVDAVRKSQPGLFMIAKAGRHSEALRLRSG